MTGDRDAFYPPLDCDHFRLACVCVCVVISTTTIPSFAMHFWLLLSFGADFVYVGVAVEQSTAHEGNSPSMASLSFPATREIMCSMF